MISESAQRRLWSKIRLPSTADGHLIWMGGTDGNGSPEFYIDARRGHHKKGKVRRVLYEMCVRELPSTAEVTPGCDVPLCVAPECMEECGRGWKNPYRRHSFEEAIERRSKT